MVKEKIAKLINVKSVVTIVLTGVFATLALTDRISGQEFLTLFTVIISFYFGTQSKKETLGGMVSERNGTSQSTAENKPGGEADESKDK